MNTTAHTPTPQDAAIARLERQGWQFSNWISAHDDADPDAQCAVLVKHPHPGSTHYAEVNPDGSVQS